jgi:hypothetical protein
MANFVYNAGLEFISENDMNTADLRAVLVMDTTTCDTENDAIATFADFTTPAEYDGSNYTTGGYDLGSITVTKNDTDNTVEIDAANASWTALGAGASACQACILIKFTTNLSGSTPIAYIDQGGFPFTGNGSDVTINWHADGILTLSSTAAPPE